MSLTDALISNITQRLLELEIAPLHLFRFPEFVQGNGWNLTKEEITDVYNSAGGWDQLLKDAKKVRIREDFWVEPAEQPFRTHNAGRNPCSNFVRKGYCLEGIRCSLRHSLDDVRPYVYEQMDREGFSKQKLLGEGQKRPRSEDGLFSSKRRRSSTVGRASRRHG